MAVRGRPSSGAPPTSASTPSDRAPHRRRDATRITGFGRAPHATAASWQARVLPEQQSGASAHTTSISDVCIATVSQLAVNTQGYS